jgi:hypothetical protein
MKKTMFKMYNADAQGATGTTSTPVIPTVKPTSPALVELEAKLKTAMSAIGIEPDSDKQQLLMLEAMAVRTEVKNEIARINKEAIDKVNAEKINLRISLADALRDTSASYALLNADKKSTEADRNAALDALNAAYDAVKTELLARYATSKPATAKTEGSTSTKGSTGAAIIALHEVNLASGMTPAESKKAIESSGHARGTTGAVVLAWEKLQGIK